ncbi:Uncharacterized protein TCM_031184 [Theobroma cacao]|uniref:Uncharacterized protein n=1 Tax=Theobroma cacao TaxID=3641 RepID=A0A061F6N9_THECC|nr:Uncharacterized protein TCM_031184 [Theobroma cacao]
MGRKDKIGDSHVEGITQVAKMLGFQMIHMVLKWWEHRWRAGCKFPSVQTLICGQFSSFPYFMRTYAVIAYSCHSLTISCSHSTCMA